MLHPESHFSDPKAGLLREATYRRLRRHWQFVNDGKLFEDVDNHTTYAVHVYGPTQSPHFMQIANLLYPATADASLAHDGSGEPPGIKLPNGAWDLRPHASRVVTLDEGVLQQWAALFDEPGTPALQARLLRPIVREHLDAIAALAAYPTRMSEVGYEWTRFWEEDAAKRDGTIEWRTATAASWDEIVLQGPHFFVGTPFGKQPNQPCTSNRDYSQWDLVALPESIIPRTNYQRSCDRATYEAGIPQWYRKPATRHYRVAWRNMTDRALQRSLIAAILPPGPGHVHAVHTLAAAGGPRSTALIAGLWSSIPFDFLIKVSGMSKVNAEVVDRLPTASEPKDQPELLLRTLRLNCLTNAFADLWSEVWDDAFLQDTWTTPFAHLPPLNAITPEWSMATPLRTDESRRAALVEIDALAALMLGLTADQLVAMYTGQMAVMRKYEYGMWFDANHRVIARDNAAKGAKQREDDFKNLQAYLAGEPCGDLLDRYAPPFHQPDREAEMRAAYAEFQQRLGL